jgi:hypothetical protein
LYAEILNAYNSNPLAWNVYERQLAIYGILYTIDLSLGTYDDLGRQYYQDQSFIESINGDLIDALKAIASNQQLTQINQTYIVENAIWILGHMLVFNEIEQSPEILNFLTQLIDQYPRLSTVFLRLVVTFDHYNNCETANSNQSFCIQDFISEIEDLILPNQFIFDDGSKFYFKSRCLWIQK